MACDSDVVSGEAERGVFGRGASTPPLIIGTREIKRIDARDKCSPRALGGEERRVVEAD